MAITFSKCSPIPPIENNGPAIDRSKAPARRLRRVFETSSHAESHAFQRPENCARRAPHRAGREFLAAGGKWLLRGSRRCSGTCSFAQRMLEEGTPTRDSLKIGEELESLSANFSAGADLDYAHVNLNALKINMDKALDIYADLILHPAFPRKNSRACKKNASPPFSAKKSRPTPWPCASCPRSFIGKGHPYTAAFIGTGTESSVNKMTREDLAKFHDTWYKPNNATLLIVGDTTLAEITPKLEKLFGSWKPGEVATEDNPAGSAAGERCCLSH